MLFWLGMIPSEDLGKKQIQPNKVGKRNGATKSRNKQAWQRGDKNQ